MKRWLLRLGALVALTLALLTGRELVPFVRMSLEPGWTIYPPGILEQYALASADAVALLSVAGALFVLSIGKSDKPRPTG